MRATSGTLSWPSSASACPATLRDRQGTDQPVGRAPGLYVPVSNIDDDNRSLALLHIERPLPHGLSFVLRYTGYFSLPGDRSGGSGAATESYQRHTGYLGLSYSYKADAADPVDRVQRVGDGA